MLTPGCYTPFALLGYWANFASLGDTCREYLSTPQYLDPHTAGTYAKYFALTCLLEFPIYAFFGGRSLSWGARVRRTLLLNWATHPLVFFMFPSLWAAHGGSYVQMVTAAEIFAPVVEAALLIYVYRQRPRTAFVSALLANLFSWWLGVYVVAWIS